MAIEDNTVFPFQESEMRHWAMSGQGGFERMTDGVLESHGGPGLFGYRRRDFADFDLSVEWRLSSIEDNSGVFVRFPALGTEHPEDWTRAVTEGCEVQIDDRGVDPKRQRLRSPLHLTGAIYELAPASRFVSRPVGEWNAFLIAARGPILSVDVNGERVAQLDRDVGRPLRGYVGLQNHHEGSRVRFRNLCIKAL